jgi:hypothetical protein
MYALAKGVWPVRSTPGFHPDIALPVLSDSNFPTPDDIKAVRSFAHPRPSYTPHALLKQVKNVTWRVTGDTLDLAGLNARPLYGFELANLLATFFGSDDWAQGIPKPKSVEIVADKGARRILQPPGLFLYSVSEFKGLEADGVILFVMSPREHLEANLYVGISRARLLLHLVMAKEAASQVPYVANQKTSLR